MLLMLPKLGERRVLRTSQNCFKNVRLMFKSNLACLETCGRSASGFAQSEVDEKGGLGLQIMRERAAQINGQLTISAEPNQGTTIKVEVKKTDE